MHCLEVLGLSNVITKDVMLKFLNIVWKNGRSFPGYHIMYRYENYGHVEFIVGLSKRENEACLFNTHIMGDYFWKLEVSEFGEFKDEEVEEHEKIVFFRHPTENKIVPVFLIMQDVIPSYLEGDTVYMQVNAFPIDIHYYKDDDAYRNSCPHMMGISHSLAPNKIFALPNSCYSNVNGKIKSVTKLVQAAKKAPELLCVVIDTDFGELPIVHAINRVDEKERDFIKEGCTVSAVCFIQGDVALEEYNPGALYDEINDLRLLRSCMKNGDYERMSNAFTDDCVYYSAKTGLEKARGKKAIIADMTDIYNQQQVASNFEHFTLLATVAECPEAKLIGRPCILLQVKGAKSPYGALMVDIDENGKIKEIKGVPSGSGLKPILPTPMEEEKLSHEDAEGYWMFGNENMWLERFDQCIHEGEMAFHTYFGIVEDAILEIYDENKVKTPVHEREKIWETFNNIFKSWNTAKDLSTDVISVVETGLEVADTDKPVLCVRTDCNTAYIMLYLSKEKKIKKICVYNTTRV